ncbi:MEGF6-like protein, partial [Mya arenaria]
MDTQFTLPFNQTIDTNTYPTDGVFDIRFSATQARYVRLILKRTSVTPAEWGKWPIVICEVEVFGPNDKAIDNNPRTDPDGCDCCSRTADGRWTIDLGRKYLIKVILILGRSDGHFEQNKPFTVSVGELTTNLTEIYSGAPNQGNHVYFITLQPAMVIQVIKVWKKTPPAILTICEFQVYGLECLDGHFGPGCKDRGFCNGTYDMATGECPSCLAGYEGKTCSKVCKSGSFGPGCKYLCGHCLTGSSCNAQTGICPKGCGSGYKGSLCTQKCVDGTFGDDCTSNCSKHCSGGDMCNKTTGLCPNGCLSGYNLTGDGLCLTKCTQGTYGLNCAEKCGNCRDGVFCNTQNGHCPSGCERGSQGAECKNGCPNGVYGYNCDYTCHCMNDSDECDSEYGNCSNGCAIGWGGQNCSSDLSIIKHDSHGVNAVQQSTFDMCNASNIYNGKTLTHATSGNYQSTNLLISASNMSFSSSGNPATIATINNASMFGTKTGVSVMSICEVVLYGKDCPVVGSFGDKCWEKCHCGDGQRCDILTGKCSSPGCLQGWRGAACNTLETARMAVTGDDRERNVFV